jgi:hypothetical protein
MFLICVYVGESGKYRSWPAYTHAWNGWEMQPTVSALREDSSVDAAPEEYG